MSKRGGMQASMAGSAFHELEMTIDGTASCRNSQPAIAQSGRRCDDLAPVSAGHRRRRHPAAPSLTLICARWPHNRQALAASGGQSSASLKRALQQGPAAKWANHSGVAAGRCSACCAHGSHSAGRLPVSRRGLATPVGVFSHARPRCASRGQMRVGQQRGARSAGCFCQSPAASQSLTAA